MAVLSSQVMINRWIWVLPADSKWDPLSPQFKAQAEIGVLLNTNPHSWLKDNGFHISGTPTSAESLISMLGVKRFDTFLIPELIYREAAKKEAPSSPGHRTVLQIAQPFGIYISKQYLAKNPGFMERLNAAIKKVVL